jgi:hypothetical protein
MPKFFKKFIGIPTFSLPQRYEFQINKMVANVQAKGASKLFELRQNDIPLFNFNFDVHNLAKAISTDIRKQRYQLSHPKQRLIKTKTKERLIYDYSLTDKIVIGSVSQLLNELLEKVISERSYAFRVGSNPYLVVKKLSDYILDLRKKKTPDLYAFKTDFVAYSDSINVGPNSVLWDYIDELFETHGIAPLDYQLDLIKQIIRPEYYSLDRKLQTNIYGAPTGTAIITFVNNLYAFKIDKLFDNQPSLFYARYCDDILLLHSNKEVLLEQIEILESEIKKIQLKTNIKKNTLACFSRSGAKQDDERFEALNYIDYLGYRIASNGLFCISKPRQRKFLRLMRQRISEILKSTHFQSIDEAGTTICHALNNYMVNKVIGEQSARSIITESSDHGQLKHLDYQLALEVAKVLTEINGVKAFRKISYRKIREKYGLKSIIMLRNGTF